MSLQGTPRSLIPPPRPPPQPLATPGCASLTAGRQDPGCHMQKPSFKVGEIRARLGHQPHWSASGTASYLLYHEFCFGSSLLYHQVHPQSPRIQPVQDLPAKEKLSGKRTHLCTSQSVPTSSVFSGPPNFLHGLAKKEVTQKAEDACKGRT